MIFIKFKSLKNFFFLLLSFQIFLGCEKFDLSIQNENWLFYHDFAISNYKWQKVYTLLDQPLNSIGTINCWKSWQNKFACTSFVPNHNGEAILQSPWWLDSNHAPPGEGFLNLIMYNYIDSIFSGKRKTLNLVNRTLYLELRAKNLNLKQSKLYFWFQTKAPNGKYINYAFIKSPIILEEGGKILKIKFTSNPIDWICLGSNNDRKDTYDCIPLKDAIYDVNIDFGLIIFPTSDDPSPLKQPEGQIFIKAIGLY
jgi:hypothetical protein